MTSSSTREDKKSAIAFQSKGKKRPPRLYPHGGQKKPMGKSYRPFFKAGAGLNLTVRLAFILITAPV